MVPSASIMSHLVQGFRAGILRNVKSAWLAHTGGLRKLSPPNSVQARTQTMTTAFGAQMQMTVVHRAYGANKNVDGTDTRSGMELG